MWARPRMCWMASPIRLIVHGEPADVPVPHVKLFPAVRTALDVDLRYVDSIQSDAKISFDGIGSVTPKLFRSKLGAGRLRSLFAVKQQSEIGGVN